MPKPITESCTEMKEKPLVSFVIWTFNQEEFVRDAIAGGISQTYSPLEIVISDDCSTDSTFAVAQDLAAAYRGPHRIVLNRNSENLGIGGNVSRAMELCHGQLIVLAGGDDISLPERTQRIVEAWNATDRRALSVYSHYSLIDKDGAPQKGLLWDCFPETADKWLFQTTTPLEFARRRRPAFCGCAHAISRELYFLFGSIPNRICHEDTVLAFRATLMGGRFVYINAPLVKYRWHGSNTTFGLHQLRVRSEAEFNEIESRRERELQRMSDVYACFANDAHTALQRNLISEQYYCTLLKTIEFEGHRFKLKRQLLHHTWRARFAAFLQLYGKALRPRDMIKHLPYVLPRTWHCGATISRNRIFKQSAAPASAPSGTAETPPV